MTKAIGWDIGIKNLAYCVLDTSNTISSLNTFTFNKTQYNILYWEDISLILQIEKNLATSGEVSHINNTLKCCFENSKVKGKAQDNTQLISICGKTAFYCKEDLTIDGKYQGYCKTHFKKLGINSLPELSVKKCWKNDCNAKPIQVLKKHIFTGYCKKHINEMIKIKSHNVTDFLNINRATTTSKIDINNLGISLFQELDKIKNIVLDAEIILLENQPVLKNPTMKSMQMFLYSYYLIRNMETNNGTMGNKKLQCYCASKKLDLIKFLPDEEQSRIMEIIDNVNNPYQKNKKLSILIVEYLLKDNKKWLDFFNNNNKKDDLADSLLMTLHYFEKANLMKIRKDDKKEEDKKNKISKNKISKNKISKNKLKLDLEVIEEIDEE